MKSLGPGGNTAKSFVGDSRFSVGSRKWEIDYNDAYDTANPTTIRPLNFQADHLPASGTQTFVAITAVPEPSTLALIAVGAGLAAVAARRRHASGRHCRTAG